MNAKMITIGKNLERECPDNDCRIYLNTFVMWKDVREALRGCLLGAHSEWVLEKEQRRLERDLEKMFLFNTAVKNYRKENNI